MSDGQAWQIRSDQRLALCGQTGSGKTYLARKLCAPLRRLVVCDGKGTLGPRSGWNLREWGRDTPRRLASGDPLRVRVQMPLGGDWEPFLWECYEKARGQLTVYIDEMYAVVPPGRSLAAHPALNALYTRGRELGIGIWAATQRPSWVPLAMFSEAEWIVLFRLRWPADRQRIAGMGGVEMMQPIRDKHGFWLLNQEWDSPLYYRSVKSEKGTG